jgi:arylsulfatase A-like enzyme
VLFVDLCSSVNEARIPYIFRWPGRIEAGSDTDERFINVDLYPTLLSMAGLPMPGNHILDGIDISPVLLGKEKKLPEREIYCFFPKYAQYHEKTGRWKDSWRNVVYSGHYKLIEYPEYEEVELFNLKDDPSEKKDVSKEQPEKTEFLTRTLHDWLKGIGAPKPEPNLHYSLK